MNKVYFSEHEKLIVFKLVVISRCYCRTFFCYIIFYVRKCGYCVVYGGQGNGNALRRESWIKLHEQERSF